MFSDRPDPVQTDRSARTCLDRIAAALQVPVSVFAIEDAGTSDPVSEAHEALELIRLFHAIRDPEDKRRCLDFIRAVAAEASLTAAFLS